MSLTGTLPAGHAEDAGLIHQLGALLASLADYFGARLQLAGLESKEALLVYGKLALWVVGGVVAAVFAHIFLCIAVIFLVAFWTGINWPWIALIVAALHAAATVAAGFAAKELLTIPQFQATIGEFRKDQQWLSSTTRTPKGN